MFELFGLGLVLFVLISLILPWLHRGDIRELKERVDGLQRRLAQQGTTFAQQTAGAEAVDEAGHAAYERGEEETISVESLIAIKPIPASMTPSALSESETPEQKQPFQFHEEGTPVSSPDEKSDSSFEQQFGGKAFVWLGGIALALAGFFMVKYSIETGLLSPSVRVVLGLIFGVGLLGAGTWVRTQPRFANGERIAQALSGAGIADLYVSIFAATTLYELVPPYFGFAGLAAVTATAVVLSLRHGIPIAVLGMVGGFVTPALVQSSHPQAPLLFLYLYVVLTGLMVVIRRQNWWPLSIPAVFGAFAWVLIWLFSGNFVPNDALYLGMFLLAVSGTIVIASKKNYDDESRRDDGDFKPARVLNYIAMGGALLLMGVVAAHSDFGPMEWGLYGLLSAGGIGLACFNQKLYGLVPWLSMAVNAVMLMAWDDNVPQDFAVVLTAFAVLYMGSAYVLQRRSDTPLLWAGLTAATGLGYYLLGYVELKDTQLLSGIPLFWGLLALGLAVLGTYALQEIMRNISNAHPRKQHMLAVYAVLTTAFLSIGLTIELKHEFLSVAFAAEVLALALINTRVDIKALRAIASVLACVFGFLLMPQLLLLVQLSAYSLVEARLYLQESPPIVNWPVFQLGLPAVFFVFAGILLRRQQDGGLVRSLEVAAIALVGIMGYYLTRHAFHVDENVLFVKANFVERSVITNGLFVYGLACLWMGKRFARDAVSSSGLVLAGVAIFRIVYFDFVLYNPLWSAQQVGELPVLNALFLTYGLPIVWTRQVNQELKRLGKTSWGKLGYGFMLVLAFTLISLNVRQFFHGSLLDSNVTTNAEVYTYSAVWLAFAIGLLFLGTLRQDKMIRVASLAIMLLTVGKVFLYDASELTGLWRVFSFFGLGLSLLGLSWFYSRFVFAAKR